MVISGNRKIVHLLGLAGVVSTLAACGNSSRSGADLFHEQDEPVRNAHAFNWAQITNAQYDAVVAPLLGITDESLDANHDLTKRTQFWIDQLDAKLRAHYGAALANAPRPTARVIVNPTVNAFIAPVPVCVRIATTIDGNGSQNATSVYFDVTTGEVSSFPSSVECLEQSVADSQLVDMITQFNSTVGANSACRIALTGTGSSQQVTINDRCRVAEDGEGIHTARRIAFMRTASMVNIYSGIVSVMDENNFVAVIAHELGHYYRSHITAPEDFFGYFYSMEEEARTGKPVADASLASLGSEAVEASSYVQSSGLFQPVAHQSLDSKLFMAAGTLVKAICRTTSSCPSACTPASQLINNRAFLTNISRFPFRELSSDGVTSYNDFETKVNACFASIDLADTDLDWDTLRAVVAQPSWPSWIAASPDVRQAILGITAGVASGLPATEPTGITTLAVAFNKMTVAFRAKDTSSMAALRQVFERHIGHYTFEQEADEISGEWLPKLGINPVAGVETYLKFGRWAADQGFESGMPFDLGSAACETLYNNNWVGADGAYQFVGMGDLADPHHGFCYRAFNLSRDIGAHNFAVAPGVQSPTLPANAPTWSDIQAQAEQLTSGQRPQRMGGGRMNPNAAFMSKWSTDCTFAPKELHHRH